MLHCKHLGRGPPGEYFCTDYCTEVLEVQNTCTITSTDQNYVKHRFFDDLFFFLKLEDGGGGEIGR